jgi:Heterokaryon incompatibility protein (HET)
MKSIYERAHRVVAWIGPHAQGSEIAMAKLTEIMQVIRDQVVEGEDEITATQFVADNLMNAILGEKISDFQNLWDSLTDFFSRPWFYRIWVVREAASSAETILMCGNN